MSSPDVSAGAAEALRLVQADPGSAAPLARSALEVAYAEGDEASASVAERATGLAAFHLDDLGTAVTHLRYAMAHGRSARSPQLVAEARMSLAYVLNLRGSPRRAVREIDAALGDLDAVSRARALAQRGAIHQQQGSLDLALHDYRLALPALRRAGDAVWVQRVLSNRGVLHAFRHEYALATKDLDEAREVCEAHGLTLQAAFVEENLLLVTRRLGDIPASLAHLSRAEALYRAVGTPSGSVLVERSELLLSMRLFAEAREAAASAVAELERAHRRLGSSEARVLLARAAIMDGDPELAVEQASLALREFRAQGRAEWVALARCGLLISQSAMPGRTIGAGRLARAAADADAHG
ncbi:hypothetical protein, partial [Nostocoides japonicum]|uniref:hypothetical protein n=1 Tax=Nostocoides japonicum TaxID=99481 RepID=UPI00065B83C5